MAGENKVVVGGVFEGGAGVKRAKSPRGRRLTRMRIRSRLPTDRLGRRSGRFRSFFSRILGGLPRGASTDILGTCSGSGRRTRGVLSGDGGRFSKVFSRFLGNISRRGHGGYRGAIRTTSLATTVVNYSPVPFSSTFLLIPIRLAVVSHLRGVFNRS